MKTKLLIFSLLLFNCLPTSTMLKEKYKELPTKQYLDLIKRIKNEKIQKRRLERINYHAGHQGCNFQSCKVFLAGTLSCAIGILTCWQLFPQPDRIPPH